MGRFTTQYEGVSYTHRLLWEIAEQQAAMSRERPREWTNFSIVAVTFAFHALEAYVNFAGEQLAPALWADERNSFSREPYRGFKGKLRKALELTHVPWAPEARPLKTALELKELRDAIAHGKSERFSETFQHVDPEPNIVWVPNSTIRSLVMPKDRVHVVLGDVENLLESMHPAVAAVVDEPFFKTSAVGGPAMHWTSSTRLTE